MDTNVSEPVVVRFENPSIKDTAIQTGVGLAVVAAAAFVVYGSAALVGWGIQTIERRRARKAAATIHESTEEQ